MALDNGVNLLLLAARILFKSGLKEALLVGFSLNDSFEIRPTDILEGGIKCHMCS